MVLQIYYGLPKIMITLYHTLRFMKNDVSFVNIDELQLSFCKHDLLFGNIVDFLVNIEMCTPRSSNCNGRLNLSARTRMFRAVRLNLHCGGTQWKRIFVTKFHIHNKLYVNSVTYQLQVARLLDNSRAFSSIPTTRLVARRK